MRHHTRGRLLPGPSQYIPVVRQAWHWKYDAAKRVGLSDADARDDAHQEARRVRASLIRYRRISR